MAAIDSLGNTIKTLPGRDPVWVEFHWTYTHHVAGDIALLSPREAYIAINRKHTTRRGGRQVVLPVAMQLSEKEAKKRIEARDAALAAQQRDANRLIWAVVLRNASGGYLVNDLVQIPNRLFMRASEGKNPVFRAATDKEIEAGEVSADDQLAAATIGHQKKLAQERVLARKLAQKAEEAAKAVKEREARLAQLGSEPEPEILPEPEPEPAPTQPAKEEPAHASRRRRGRRRKSGR